MICYPVTLYEYWHRADQFRFVALLSQCWASSERTAGIIFRSLVWLGQGSNQQPSGHKADALTTSHCAGRLKGNLPADFRRRFLPYEPAHDKTNKVTGLPVKSQISMGIRPVWQSLLCAQWVAKDPMFLRVDSKKVKTEKSRECHNPRRGQSLTPNGREKRHKPTSEKPNKCTKSTQTSFLFQTPSSFAVLRSVCWFCGCSICNVASRTRVNHC